ncbi:MAG: pyridoxal phosphate-dependent aminotransferase family protein [Anaerolineales bacterium]|nr:pyridoxal phosphate-dependent aminotransferase family protein [Anaerolineales bacterium]
MDIFEKCGRFTDAKDAKASGLYPYFIPMEGNEGTEAVFQGRRLIMCGSNNYLGLTMDPRVREAAEQAIRQYGTSCTGSRFLNGTLEMHEQLEHELAEFVGKEAALVFSTGMQVNLGTISALVGRGDYVILDKEDHASLVDGAKLSWGETKRFKHNDMQDLERVLASLPDDKGKLVVVDGLYSMEGDLAPLPEMVPIVKKYGARLMVDDAHGIGVVGKGRGTGAHFGMTGDVDLIMATFSKSFASLGGFIAGDETVIDFIKHHARALIFSASIPPANAAAALAALHIMRDEPQHCERLNKIADRMRKEYRGMGYDIGNSVSPIIPIILGDDLKTILSWKVLFDEGVFVNPVISPGVAPGRQLLRTSYIAAHTDAQMDRVLEVFRKVGKNLGMIQ